MARAKWLISLTDLYAEGHVDTPHIRGTPT